MKLREFWPSLSRKLMRVGRGPRWAQQLRSEITDTKLLVARLLIEQMRARGPLARLADAEFKVFSQFGDDGIIQYLVHRLAVQPQTFVEFGVENYRESNTRFLLANDNWQGLVLDASNRNVQTIRSDEIFWRHDLNAVSAFITRENINDLLTNNGCQGSLGLLSIDIDGNDYWVWERIECVEPVIVVVEYNSLFGADKPVAVPYDPLFYRTNAHWSNLYFGCSLAALCFLAEKKGYVFVGSNSHGNNAYFVHRKHLGDLQPLTAALGYFESRFRESRNQDGKLSFLRGKARRDLIADLPVVDVETGRSYRVGDL